MSITLVDCTVFGLALLLFRWVHNRQSNRHPNAHHPPGPPGLPLIGNFRDLPTQPVWLAYRRWSQKYNSDLIRMNIFGKNIVVVNSLNAVVELLEKRSAIYSDRPDMTMLSELCGYGWMLAVQKYGNLWRDGRRAFHQEFNAGAVKRFRPVAEKATAQFLKALLDHPNDLMNHLRQLAGSEIMKIAYAIDIKEKDDPYVLTAEHALGSISATTNAGSYLVDTLNFLKYLPEWVPGASFQKEARMWRKSVMRMRDAPYEVVKQRMAEGEMPECVATSLMEGIVKKSKDPSYMEHIAKCTLGAMFTGGADTTVSALGSFFLAMVLYPEVQVKAQAEIDRVLETGRLPSFSDYSSLPYIEAIVKETLRWNPVTPLNSPHRSIADDIYAGYYLPKGTTVIANIWSILHDQKAYPDPLVYNPDRFMKDGKINPDVLDPTAVAFGFGRRVCPGRYMAFESMWIAIASTLAVCTISKAKNEAGVAITPSGEYEMGFLCYPKPFPLHVLPRSADHEVLVRELNTLE